MAKVAKEQEWNVIGVLNNDMIGNIEGVDGVIDNRSFRIFSEPTPVTEEERARRMRRFYGGEVDGVSRQLARYVHKQTTTYMPEMNPRSEEHTSELQSPVPISYAVFCLKKKIKKKIKIKNKKKKIKNKKNKNHRIILSRL